MLDIVRIHTIPDKVSIAHNVNNAVSKFGCNVVVTCAQESL